MIDEVNTGRTKITGCKNKELEELERETKDKEKEIRKNRRSKVKEETDKATFNYRATDDTPFYFGIYTHLLTFAEDVYKKELSFDKAKEEQEEILKKNNELKKRIDPKGSRKPKNQTKIGWRMWLKIQRIFICLGIK